MPREARYVAVYDVSSDRERERVAKVLEGFGVRVQYSAFELRLTSATRPTLLRRLEDLKLETGWVALYRRAGGQDRAAVGQVPENPLTEERHACVLVEAPIAPPVPAPRPPPRRPAPVPRRKARRPASAVLTTSVLPKDFRLDAGPAQTPRDG
jgi:CRISPR-associated protein Cas2